MTVKKIIRAVLLPAACICLLSGCGSGEGDRVQESSVTELSQEELKDPEENDRNSISFLVYAAYESLARTYEENETINRLEEECGTELSFEILPWADQEEGLDRIFGSGQLPDVMILTDNANYKGGISQAVKDGVYWDLTEYVEPYMPNYYSLLCEDEEIRRMAYDDDNRITGLLILFYNAANGKVENGPAAGGMIIRKDWLTECGLSLPVTYADWETVLTAFRDNYDCTQPLYIPGNGYSEESPGFCSGMGVLPSMQMNGSEVVYGPMTDGWKAYVALMHEWYEKGLIGSEYLTNDPLGIDADACIREETGSMLYYFARVGYLEQEISGKADFCAVQYPVLKKGQTAQGGEQKRLADRSVFVTKAVTEDRLPEVLGFLDHLYDKDAAVSLSYGAEGEDYIRTEDGKVVFTDAILDDAEGRTWEQIFDEKLMPSRLMLLRDWSREVMSNSPEETELREVWDRDGMDLYLPQISLDAKEENTASMVLEAVRPYVRTMTNQMIVGAADIDLTWDGYVQTIRGMGIEDAVRAYQNAYNRYVHRR